MATFSRQASSWANQADIEMFFVATEICMHENAKLVFRESVNKPSIATLPCAEQFHKTGHHPQSKRPTNGARSLLAVPYCVARAEGGGASTSCAQLISSARKMVCNKETVKRVRNAQYRLSPWVLLEVSAVQLHAQILTVASCVVRDCGPLLCFGSSLQTCADRETKPALSSTSGL